MISLTSAHTCISLHCITLRISSAACPKPSEIVSTQQRVSCQPKSAPFKIKHIPSPAGQPSQIVQIMKSRLPMLCNPKHQRNAHDTPFSHFNSPIVYLTPNTLAVIATRTDILLAFARYRWLLVDRTAKTLAIVSTWTALRVTATAIFGREGVIDEEEVRR